jgi:hypothetical protein
MVSFLEGGDIRVPPIVKQRQRAEEHPDRDAAGDAHDARHASPRARDAAHVVTSIRTAGT